MKITQLIFKNNELIVFEKDDISDPQNANLILGFGKKELIENGELNNLLQKRFPSAQVVLCSTAGEIVGGTVQDEIVVITAIQFEKTSIKVSAQNITQFSNSFELGKSLIQQLDKKDLAYILILSDGLLVNGTQLVSGMQFGNEGSILITGGLAGDGVQFDYTLVGINTNPLKGNVVAVGFYGANLDIRSSSISGWDVFGPERIVTKASGTKVFEIDQQSAIDLYKTYLGPYINDQTNSTLLFPLAVKLPGKSHYFARSILSINHKANCMVFAGDVPEGSTIRFMKASFEKLIKASEQAAQQISGENINYSPELALLVSCVGRKTILDQQIEEEVAVVSDHFGSQTAIAGFYSYGEISPNIVDGPCELHNQTMTITTFNEL